MTMDNRVSNFRYLIDAFAAMALGVMGWLAAVGADLEAVGQVLSVIASGLMAIITILVRHLLDKGSRRDRQELRELRDENHDQSRAINNQAAQINGLTQELVELRLELKNLQTGR